MSLKNWTRIIHQLKWVILLLPISLFSQQWEMDITLGTYHYNRYYLWNLERNEFNEFNPGVLLYRRKEDWKLGGGVILNSYERVSYLIGIGYDVTPKVSVVGGFITGYGNTDVDKSIVPMGMVTYKIGRFKIGASPAFVIAMMSFKL
jgi:hypothetical protein